MIFYSNVDIDIVSLYIVRYIHKLKLNLDFDRVLFVYFRWYKLSPIGPSKWQLEMQLIGIILTVQIQLEFS